MDSNVTVVLHDAGHSGDPVGRGRAKPDLRAGRSAKFRGSSKRARRAAAVWPPPVVLPAVPPARVAAATFEMIAQSLGVLRGEQGRGEHPRLTGDVPEPHVERHGVHCLSQDRRHRRPPDPAEMPHGL